MPNNVRVLANAESITTNNQAKEQDKFLNLPAKPKRKQSKQMEALIKENEILKVENLRLKKAIIEIGRETMRELKQDSNMWVV